jgi:hypothetical protein
VSSERRGNSNRPLLSRALKGQHDLEYSKRKGVSEERRGLQAGNNLSPWILPPQEDRPQSFGLAQALFETMRKKPPRRGSPDVTMLCKTGAAISNQKFPRYEIQYTFPKLSPAQFLSCCSLPCPGRQFSGAFARGRCRRRLHG